MGWFSESLVDQDDRSGEDTQEQELASDCCGADINSDMLICMQCKEHAETIDLNEE